MAIMENTQMAEDHILLLSTLLHPETRGRRLIIRTLHTGAELIPGTGDTTARVKLIEILTTRTESRSQSDPAPEPVSTPTDLHLGKAILTNTTEQTEVPTVNIMQIIPSTMITQRTTMDSMTHDTEDTMIRPTGRITTTPTEQEKTTIINKCILPGKTATTTSGVTIPATTPVSMTITAGGAKCTATTSTAAASTASSRPTACEALTVTTAGGAASARDLSRVRDTGASPIWCLQLTTPRRPLWLWITPTDSTPPSPTPPRATASTRTPPSTPPTAPGSPRSSLLLDLRPRRSSPSPTAALASDPAVIWFKSCPTSLQPDSPLWSTSTTWRQCYKILGIRQS